MKLLIQPGDSIRPLVKGIDRAKKSVEIVIFRFDRVEIERALENAVKRGVFVHALIAFTNRGGEKNLRKLEMRFLAGGITVARTSDDLVRYHGKMMIVDRKELYLLAFNLTHLDIEHSRSFGIVTRNRVLVQEAEKLFESDTKCQNYTPGSAKFLVSPLNARKQLSSFIKGAKKELLIYDMKITDRAMTRLLEERAEAGVQVRIIGKITRKTNGRREIGIIVPDRKVISSVIKVFEEDWNSTAAPKKESASDQPHATATKAAKRVAKSIAKDLPPVGPVVERVIKEVTRQDSDIDLDQKEVEEAVKSAVKDAVREAVQGVIKEVSDQKDPRGK